MRAKIALKNCPFCGGKVSLNLGMLVGLPMIYCKNAVQTLAFTATKHPKEQSNNGTRGRRIKHEQRHINGSLNQRPGT